MVYSLSLEILYRVDMSADEGVAIKDQHMLIEADRLDALSCQRPGDLPAPSDELELSGRLQPLQLGSFQGAKIRTENGAQRS
jgi:hypothetical protein